MIRFEAPLRAGRSSGPPLWDSPLSFNDALSADAPLLSSDEIVVDGGETFRVDVYPRGLTGRRGAAVYLRYLPATAGDECDVSFSLSLVNGGELSRTSSGCGGAARGGSSAWRGAMTFCASGEAVESCGRAADWGAHAWPPLTLANKTTVVGEIAVWERRSDERSGALRGALRAVAIDAFSSARAAFKSGEVVCARVRMCVIRGPRIMRRTAHLRFKINARGTATTLREVVVPVANSELGAAALRERGLESGGEYRVMEMRLDGDADADADSDSGMRVFRADARGGSSEDDDSDGGRCLILTLRPAVDVALSSGAEGTTPVEIEWPVDVSVASGDLGDVAWRSRFDARAFSARALFDLRRSPLVDGSVAKAIALIGFWLASALAPIPLVLGARSFASVYVIPSESMAPTLRSGDVLLVDKVGLKRTPLPRVGDIVVFDQPPALRALVDGSVPKSAQFVKRVVALPGEPVVFESRIDERTLPLCAAPAPALAKALSAAAKERENGVVARDSVFVRGDCDGVSVDSRIWGDLDRKFLVGRPTYRLWPPARVGPL